MTSLKPPLAPDIGTDAKGSPAAVSVLPAGLPTVLTKRADFVRASSARRQGTPGIHLQGRDRDDDGAMRVGFTCSKRVGNAVARNRAKRRLREVARLVLPLHGRPGWDYVLVGRAGATATRDFRQMQADLIRALAAVHT